MRNHDDETVEARRSGPRLKLKAQLLVGEEIAFGPGKADLLDAIAATGSISGGARSMGLSYRRAWLMVEAMNRLFKTPLVVATKGARGGATVTAAGQTALSAYRGLQADLTRASAAAETRLLPLLD